MAALIFVTHPNDIERPKTSNTSDQHRAIQESLLFHGAQKRLFRKRVEAAVGARFADAPRIIPDAFTVLTEERRIVIFEVCVSYTPQREKLGRIASWFRWLASHGWSARLLYVTEHGATGIDPENGEHDAEQRRALLELLGGTT